MATNRSYSKTKLAAADIVTSHIFFPCTNFLYPPGGILKTVNKLIVIKSNPKNLDEIRLKNRKNQSKKLQQFTKLCKGDTSQNSKMAKWFWGDIIAC